MSDLSMFIILEMSLLYIFFNVVVNVTSVFTKVKFLDCLHHFFDGVFDRLRWATNILSFGLFDFVFNSC